MNVDRLTDETVKSDLLTILKQMVEDVEKDNHDSDCQRIVYQHLIDGVLDPLASDDFWGTEGWERWFGMGD